MNKPETLDAWRRLLPRNVVVCAGPPLEQVPPITIAEERSAGPMNAGRMLEFAVGRAYAKRALSELGIEKTELLRGLDGAPQWPPGVTGSITHTKMSNTRHFAVAVAKTDFIHRIGIDAEVIDELRPSSWSQFLNAYELNVLLSLPVNARAHIASTIWCAKEAVMKAIGCKVDPLEIEAIRKYSGRDSVASWCINLPTDRFAYHGISASTAYFSTLVLGAVVIAKPGSDT
jgi:phosphopantetheinyl transferase (holo-ACP synthase)